MITTCCTFLAHELMLRGQNLKRQDDPAEIWQYQTRACTLYIFLYRAAKGDAYKVRHFETSARGKDGVSEKACFVGLLKAHDRLKAG